VNQLIKNSKFVKTAIAAAALGIVGMSTQAATMNVTAVKYAQEQFLGSTPAAAVVAPSISVTAQTGIPIGSVITVMVQLNGARMAVAPTGDTVANAAANIISTAAMPAAAPTITLGSSLTVAAGGTAAAGVLATPTSTASNADVYVATFTSTVAIGIGGTLLTITTPSISAQGLATVGNVVTATATVYVGNQTAPLGAAVPTTNLLEAAAPAANVATSLAVVTQVAAAGTSTQLIDLTATTPSSQFTGGVASPTNSGLIGRARIGTYVTDNVVVARNLANAAAYTVATNTRSVVLKVTAPAGYFAPAKAVASSYEVRDGGGNSCLGTVRSTAPTFADAATALAATSITFPTFAYVAGTSYDICVNVPSNNTIVLSQVAPTVVATSTPNTLTVDSVVTSTSTSLLAYATNGATIDVLAYWPKALATYGYGGFVKVVNTGTIAAAVSGAYIDSTTGVAGTAAQLIASLPAGASTLLTSTQIEAALGTAPFGLNSGRLRITAPTNGLKTQSFVQVGNAAPQETSGAQ